jgi:hypothetical protein
LVANLQPRFLILDHVPEGELIFASNAKSKSEEMPPWTVAWLLKQ